jgi:hypothetical protein
MSNRASDEQSVSSTASQTNTLAIVRFNPLDEMYADCTNSCWLIYTFICFLEHSIFAMLYSYHKVWFRTIIAETIIIFSTLYNIIGRPFSFSILDLQFARKHTELYWNDTQMAWLAYPKSYLSNNSRCFCVCYFKLYFINLFNCYWIH